MRTPSLTHPRRAATLLGAALLAACSANPVADPPGAAGAGGCDATALGGIAALGDARVDAVAAVAPGSYAPLGSGQTLDALPAFCRVSGVATPSADSQIRFEVWVPDRPAWNGKLVATGNGGYNPALQYGDMAYALRQGYAVVGNDTGHAADGPGGLAWGVGHPEKIVDWAFRSVHATLGPAQRIVARLRGQAAARSYFYGCSSGGRQGYAAAQRHPQDFDGVIAGAPAANWVALSAESLWRYRAARRADGDHAPILTPEKTQAVAAASLAACDAIDGAADGVVDDPRLCKPPHFDVDTLRCSGGDAPACLTAPQLAAVKRLYEGPRNPRTFDPIYPGALPGTEAGWPNQWRDSAPARFGFWRLWVFGDPAWDPWRFDFDRDVATARQRLGGAVDQLDPDLGAFAARGAKLITYQGWADPAISALDTIDYADRVAATLGPARARAFSRLFVVPGMGHCGGGPGANVFGNAGNAAPEPSPANDLLMALDRWVERGIAPDRLTAVELRGGAVVSTRALCPYPTRAVYRGSGGRHEAASFDCR